ncbi:MAG: MarR family transcriptional regulator [Chloroflexi bacterium]|jgi:DNA-binding MarR family transcriptional regulator|nr:MarR family transcriptional regulator [Chloroflexota bacterium]MBT7081319.1 MarR family transcriptional regulator [Chloroflexota bacterium]MBT7290487.1 MarR family transcriptional regulator [Chloroflexota bacterium]
MSKQNAPDDLSLWIALQRLHYTMGYMRERALHREGLSMEQAFVLATIVNENRKGLTVSPSHISKRLLRAPSSTAELIGRMVKKGLVTKKRRSDKKNLVNVEITDLGLGKYEKTRDVSYFEDIFAELSSDEREALSSQTSKLLKATVNKIDSYRWLFEKGNLFEV